MKMVQLMISFRNCLISENRKGNDRLWVQLCDAALSKDLFPDDYHCIADNEARPIKWMAYESLQYNSYSSSTDVVSICSTFPFYKFS